MPEEPEDLTYIEQGRTRGKYEEIYEDPDVVDAAKVAALTRKLLGIELPAPGEPIKWPEGRKPKEAQD